MLRLRTFAALLITLTAAGSGIGHAASTLYSMDARMVALSGVGGMTDHVLSATYNPAWSASHTVGFGFAVGVNALIEAETFETITDVAEVDVTDSSSEIYRDSAAFNRYVSDLKKLDEDLDNTVIEATGAFGISYKNFRLLYTMYGALHVNPLVDLVNVSQNYNAPNSLANNRTSVVALGSQIHRFTFGYTHDVYKFESKLGDSTLRVGGNVAYWAQTSYFLAKSIHDDFWTDFDASDLVDEFVEDGEKSSSAFDLDLAVAVLLGEKLEVGMIGEHLANPELEFIAGKAFSIDPNVRVYGVYRVVEWLQLGLDADLMQTNAFLTDSKSQEIRIAGEFRIPVFPIRVGVAFDPAQEITALSAGFGLQVWKMSLNLGGKYGLDQDRGSVALDLRFFL